jgi:hypothetical protein
MQQKLFGIEHIYILCDKSYESERYSYLLQWARLNFPPDYYTISLYCYKDTICDKDIQHYGIQKEVLKPSEISLIINYNKVFEDILDKYKYHHTKTNFLILESDIIPTEHWRQKLENQMIKMKDKDYYFLHVGNGGNDTFIPSIFGHTLNNESDVYPCPSCRCTEAMVWTYTGIENAVCFKNKPITLPLDFYFNIIATNNIKGISTTKTWWGHPVSFIQGTANGTYTTTINDNIEIPNRLKNNKSINIHFEEQLMYTKDFVYLLLEKAFPNTVFTNYLMYPANIKITEKKDIRDCYCIIISDDKVDERANILLHISKNLTLESSHCFIPKVCYTPDIYDLYELKNRYIDIERYDYWFYIPDDIPVYYQYFANKLRKHSWTNNSTKKCYFRLCIDEYTPYNISDKMIDCYMKGSIPIFKGCDVLVSELFEKDSFINISEFDFEQELYKYILSIVNNTNKLQELLKMCPFKNKEIPEKLDITGIFVERISNKIKSRLPK